MNNKACTIIPTFTPHFEYTLNAIKTFNQFVGGDLYIVFSNIYEKKEFEKLTDEKFYSLILPDSQSSYESCVTVKKLFAIKHIIDNYDYVGVFDTETVFIKEYEQYILYKTIFETCEFKSNKSLCGGKMLMHTLNALEFNENERKIILEKTDNLDQYWWFNEIMVYEKNTFLEFYKWLIDHKNYENIVNDKEHFDFHMYSLWLLAFKNFNLKKLCQDNSFIHGAIEGPHDITVSEIFKSNLDIFETEYSKVIIHLNRF